jgi:hypothetical protein
VQKSELPDSRLGSRRCFQIEYMGHGDIWMAAWQGDIGLDPTNLDDYSANFGLHHGSDVFLFAALAGYLTRAGQDKNTISRTMLDAAKGVMAERSWFSKYHQISGMNHLKSVASGEAFPRYDIEDRRLRCILPPRPPQPGVLDEYGGTGAYSRQLDSGDQDFVLVRLIPGSERYTLKAVEEASFCESDAPIMARMICDLALGEYRADIFTFLREVYADESDDSADPR